MKNTIDIINNLRESLKQFNDLLDELTKKLPNTYTQKVECHCNDEKTSEEVKGQPEPWNDGFIEDKISTTLREIFSEQFEVPKKDIKPTSLLNDFGIDSLDAIELIMAVEEEFQFEIDDEKAESYQYKTFYQMVEAIRKEKGIVHKRSVKTGEHEFNSADDCQVAYVKGLECGMADLKFGFGPKFLEGDQNGADSPLHAKYIEGYLNGIKS
jgi:acyl carrier protein